MADRQAESSWGICEVIGRWRQATCVHGTTVTAYSFKTVETCKRMKVQEYKRLGRGRYKGRSDLYATQICHPLRYKYVYLIIVI